MHIIYEDINHQLCIITEDLELINLPDRRLPKGMKLLLDQVIREVNPAGGSLRVIDLEAGTATTLSEFVTNHIKGGVNVKHPSIQARIDVYRTCGLTEYEVAKVFGTYPKRLQRLYPRRMSVSSTAHGRGL